MRKILLLFLFVGCSKAPEVIHKPIPVGNNYCYCERQAACEELRDLERKHEMTMQELNLKQRQLKAKESSKKKSWKNWWKKE